jgi:hypothetical protein
MAAEIDEIAKRRYIELSKQQAAYGVSTPAEIMLEIADLRLKYGPVEYLDQPQIWRPPPERRHKMDLDLEFLIAQVGSLTNRQQQSEQRDRLFVRNLYATWIVLAVAMAVGLVAYVAR